MPSAVVVVGIGVKGILVEVAVGFAAVTAVAEATFGVAVDCVTLAAGLAVCDFLAVLLSVVVFLAVGVLAAFVVAVLVVVVVLVTALVAGAVLAVVSETVLVAANA